MEEKSKKRKREKERKEDKEDDDSTEGMEDPRSEKDIEAGKEEASEEDDDTMALPTDINNIARLDKLFAILEQHPDNPIVLVLARATIRKFYMAQGGATINTADPIPVNLETMSAADLSHVLQNMILEQVKSKRNRITEQALNLLSNITYLGSMAVGSPISKTTVDQVGGDHILRDAFVETFLGTSGKFSSFMTLIVGSLNHASNLLVHHVEERAAKRRRYTETQAQAQAGHIPPGISTPFDGRPATTPTKAPPPQQGPNSSSSSSSSSSQSLGPART